jgi:hypothetical protein
MVVNGYPVACDASADACGPGRATAPAAGAIDPIALELVDELPVNDARTVYDARWWATSGTRARRSAPTAARGSRAGEPRSVWSPSTAPAAALVTVRRAGADDVTGLFDMGLLA